MEDVDAPPAADDAVAAASDADADAGFHSDDADATAADADADADVHADEALGRLAEELSAMVAIAGELESRLAEGAATTLSTETLKDAATQIPVLNGNIDRLQLRVDAVCAGTKTRTRRKELVASCHKLSERVHLLPSRLASRVAATADAHKAEGTRHYKAGNYDAAIKCYTEAITVDRRNPIYFCNRSACQQAKSNWKEAIADAKEATYVDVNSLKGYLFQIKAHLRLGGLSEAVGVLCSAPLALRSSDELKEATSNVLAEAKEAGNRAFKAGRYEAAVAAYSLAAVHIYVHVPCAYT